ncbi:hypothetical protein [Psychrobacter sp. TB55-MNA-CIBAN-0194]|uniref:glycoside hydrolase family 19 protein n=1 Tax=Psychrobacter sp. TB55-MNA-CIBAN-0194 TaxID=3140445 RepID=UPI003323382A
MGTSTNTSSQKEKLITIAIESGRFGVIKASDKKNIKEVKITQVADLISEQQMQKMFPNANTRKREVVRALLNKYMPKFGMTTPLRISHFLAHVQAEVGDELVGKEESLWYSVSSLRNTFNRYFKHYPEEADQLGYKRIPINDYNKLSQVQKKIYIRTNEAYAYSQLPQENEIAKRVYACNTGDGYFDYDNVLKGGDLTGLLYKGKGFIQLTWKGNYKKVNEILNNKMPEENLDIMKNPNNIINTREGILTALGFWEWQKLNQKADKGKTGSVVDSITDDVNYHTGSRQKRKDNFTKFYAIMAD